MSVGATNQPQIFIIEDDDMLRETFMDIFEMHGCRVEYAADGEKALERLQNIRPDVILMDLHLPKLSGQALLLKIKETSHLRDAQIVLLTADVLKAKTMEAQVHQVILKPVGYEVLAKLAQSLIQTLE